MKHTFVGICLLVSLLGTWVAPLMADGKPRVSYEEYLKAHPKGKGADSPVPQVQSKPPVDLEQPIAILTLKNGRQYKNVRLVSFGAQTVTLSWLNGAAAVEYKQLPDDIRAAAEAKKPGAQKPTSKNGKMTPRGPYYIEGTVMEKSNGVVILECSGPPFRNGNKDGKIPYLTGNIAVKNPPQYAEIGVKDFVVVTAMRVGDFDSPIFGQVPLISIP